MSEIHKLMVDIIKKVGTGDVPLKTAEQQHLAAHRAVMDQYVDIRKKEIGMDEVFLERAKLSLAKM